MQVITRRHRKHAPAVQGTQRVSSRLQSAAYWEWSNYCYTSYTMNRLFLSCRRWPVCRRWWHRSRPEQMACADGAVSVQFVVTKY